MTVTRTLTVDLPAHAAAAVATAGNGMAMSPSSTGTGMNPLLHLGRLIGLAAGPRAFLDVFLSANPAGQAAVDGRLEGDPSVTYSYQEGLLTVIGTDEDGNRTLVSSGPSQGGIYYDAEGRPIARWVGDQILFNESALQQARLAARAKATDAADEEVKLCPDPTLDIPGGVGPKGSSRGMYNEGNRDIWPRGVLYQAQITGLPPGLAVKFNGVTFDGCRTANGTLLEAKGEGFAWAFNRNPEWLESRFDAVREAKAQMDAQSVAAAGRRVEWHVADAAYAAYLDAYAKRMGYMNIIVTHTPMVKP